MILVIPFLMQCSLLSQYSMLKDQDGWLYSAATLFCYNHFALFASPTPHFIASILSAFNQYITISKNDKIGNKQLNIFVNKNLSVLCRLFQCVLIIVVESLVCLKTKHIGALISQRKLLQYCFK